MLLAGALLVPCPRHGVRLIDGAIRLNGGRIAAIEPGHSATPDLGGPGWLISPGLIDAHLHLPQFDSIGADRLELLQWLDQVIFPAEARWADPDFAAHMTARVINQLLAHGTTSFAAYATVHHDATQAAIHAAGELGIQAVIGQVLMDRAAPPELIRPADELIRQAATLIGHGSTQPIVSPRFAISCTERLLRAAGDLAARTGQPIQTHLAETRDECARIQTAFNGLPYTQVYRQAGLLTPRSILGHGIWLDDADRRTLATARAVIAHCPTANLFLRSGDMDLAATRRANVRVALGSDIAGGPDRSMVRVARAMLETAKRLGHTPPTAAQCWHQITAGNAAALGWTDCGLLAPGARADVLMLRPDIPWRDTPDPLSTLLYAWDDRWLRRTLVAGRTAYDADAGTGGG